MRTRALSQAALWALLSGLAAPILVQAVYTTYLRLRYSIPGLSFASEFLIDLRLYFLPGLLVTLAVITVVTVLILAWPRLSTWLIVLPSLPLLTFAFMWLLWVNSQLVSESQARELGYLVLVGLALPRVLVPPLFPGRAYPSASFASSASSARAPRL